MAGLDPDRELFQARVREWKTVHALAVSLGIFAAAFVLFGLPRGLGLRSDDFGYVRSILGSLENGGIHTYEWLAPFNAVMTGLCSLGWMVTGNLPVTAALYSGAAAFLAFILLFRLLAARTTPGWAAMLTLAFAMSPVFFNKAADFHGSVLTLVLFLLALGAHEERRPGLFMAAAFLAFANRQSGIVLILLPLMQAALDIRKGRVIRARLPAYLALFAVAACGLRLYMNRTYAQSPDAVFTGADWRDQLRLSSLALVAGGSMLLAFLSLFGLAGRSPLESLRRNLSRPFLPAYGTAVLAGCSFYWPANLVRTDFPLFGAFSLGSINAALPWGLALSLWFLDRRLLRPTPYLLLAGAYVAITSLRGIWWDYYLMEIAVLGLLTALSGAGRAAGTAVAAVPAAPGRTAHAVAVLCIAVGLGYAYLLKVMVDRQVLAATVFERLEREGRVDVDRMSNAPFGFLGWKLFDWWLADGARGSGPMEDFQRYVRAGHVMVESHAPWRRSFRNALPPGAEILETGRARVGYIEVEYRVADLRGPETGVAEDATILPLDHGRYVPRPFPMNSREWNELAEKSERTGRNHWDPVKNAR